MYNMCFLKDEESANMTWEVVFPLALFFFYFLKFSFGLLINWIFDMVNSSTVQSQDSFRCNIGGRFMPQTIMRAVFEDEGCFSM